MSFLNGLKRGPSSLPEPITLSSDSDTEPSITKQTSKRPRTGLSSTSALGPSSATLKSERSHSPSPNTVSSRAQLEADRLARQQARQADPNQPGSSYTIRPAPRAVNIATINSAQPEPTAVPSGSSGGKGKGVTTFANLNGGGGPKHELRFWKGALKRVPNIYR